MKIAKGIAFGSVVLSGLLSLFQYGLPWAAARYLLPAAARESAASIGVIGGADGPTAIFVATKTAPHFPTAVIFAFSLVVWLRLCLTSKKTK